MEKPLQQRAEKTTGASPQNFTISEVFTNTVGYLMMRFTLAGDLHGVKIGDGNDPYREGLSPPQPPQVSLLGLALLIRSCPLLYRN
jgi:hypothetical protein